MAAWEIERRLQIENLASTVSPESDRILPYFSIACSKLSLNGAEMEQKNDGANWSRYGANRPPAPRAAIYTRVHHDRPKR